MSSAKSRSVMFTGPNVAFLATLHNLFHSCYIMHVFQELVLLS